MDGVSLEEAINTSDVARASAYRLWSTDSEPQAAFRRDVLLHVLTAGLSDSEIDLTTSAIEDAITDAIPSLETGDPGAMAAALREILRQVGRVALDECSRAPTWPVYLGAMGGLVGHRDDEVHDAVRAGEERTVGTFAGMIIDVARVFGLRLRAGYSIEHFGTAAAAAVEGCALRADISNHIELSRPTGHRGQPQDWTLYAVMLEGIALALFEPEPDCPASARIRDWIVPTL